MSPRSLALLFRFTAALFALAGVVYGYTAVRGMAAGHLSGFPIAMAVTYFALAAVFVIVGRAKPGGDE